MRLHEMIAVAREIGSQYGSEFTAAEWSEAEAWGALHEALVDTIGLCLTDCSDRLRDRLMDEARECARAACGAPRPTWTVVVDGVTTEYPREGWARAAAQRASRSHLGVTLSESGTGRSGWTVRVEARCERGRWHYHETEVTRWVWLRRIACDQHGETWTAHPEAHCRKCRDASRPMLEGPGDRRSDCTGYAGCLRGAALADGEWHRSPTCEHHEPIPVEALRAVATASRGESRVYPPSWST